jgi:hypothetical protein
MVLPIARIERHPHHKELTSKLNIWLPHVHQTRDLTQSYCYFIYHRVCAKDNYLDRLTSLTAGGELLNIPILLHITTSKLLLATQAKTRKAYPICSDTTKYLIKNSTQNKIPGPWIIFRNGRVDF